MDSTEIQPRKRSYSSKDLSGSDNLSHILEGIHKKQKPSNIPRFVDDFKAAPLLHSVPSNIVPIIQPPLTLKEFFSDLDIDSKDDLTKQQIDGILKKFPPPIPPYLPEEVKSTNGGIMIPFIYPPPPVIDHRKLPFALHTINDNTMNSYLQVPPLPFPPPNYMPYPLVADKAPLTPTEVFDVFLNALENLPRIDMVVASAAGSLFDMKSQATEEGFTVENHENERRIGHNESEYFDSDENDRDSEQNEIEKYIEYAKNVDTTDVYDYYDRNALETNTNIDQFKCIPEGYLDISPNISDIKNKDIEQKKSNNCAWELYNEIKDANFKEIDTSELYRNKPKEIIMANGNNREKRRSELKDSLGELSALEFKEREYIFKEREQAILQRIKNIKESNIGLDKFDIRDGELLKFAHRMQESRDLELLRLKLSRNYELLKLSETFYQETNKVYKNMQLIVTNKLKKLKNFFEFQKELFIKLLQSNDSDIFDIKSKEAYKLFIGISDRDFNSEIKDIIKRSLHNDLDDNISLHLGVPNQNQNPALVHDFMPLVSSSEFELITGDVPGKGKINGKDKSLKKTIQVKHQIFQNSLYDPITSGSDTNGSENLSSAPGKRRGRRGAGSQNTGDKLIDDESRNSEAILLAKIMKNFSGPQAIKPEELSNDFELLGLKSRFSLNNLK